MSSDIKVKICGLKTPSDIDFCIKANADFIGLVFFETSDTTMINQIKNHSDLVEHINTY